MSDIDIKEIHKEIISNNYLSNCYRHLTNSKIIHFLITLIEITLNIIQELDTYLRDFHPANNTENNNKLSFIFNLKKVCIKIRFGDWGLGIGDWGLGIGPNPQSPIPNPQSPIPIFKL